jgi:hypothetical protein
MNFEKDIFISYAHIDEEEIGDDVKGWITDFHELLQKRVTQIWGKHPVIWRDDRLQGNDDFEKEIEAQFPKLKVLVSIITPRYVDSKWCIREVNTFLSAAEKNGGLLVENKVRIFKILKTPVELEEQPEKIRPYIGYQFYKKDNSGKMKEFLKAFGKESEYEFNNKVDDVAQDIVKLIKKLSTPASGKTSDNNNQSTTLTYNKGISTDADENSKLKIYLADTSYDLSVNRDSIKHELEDSGFTVFPNKILTTAVADKYVSEVEEFVKDCALSIHLIDADYGLVPGKTSKSVIDLQNEVVSKISSERSINRLIWISPESNTGDERQKEFTNRLRNEKLNTGSDLLEGTLEDFKFAIFDNIRKIKAKEKEDALLKAKQNGSGAATIVTVPGKAAPRRVYLICGPDDLDDTKAIEDFLFGSKHEVITPLFDGSPEEIHKDHTDNLQQCDAVIIYYGKQNEGWLRPYLGDLRGINGLGRTKPPLLDQVIYLANPSTPTKVKYRSNEFTVVSGLDGFKPELLNNFIAKLK